MRVYRPRKQLSGSRGSVEDYRDISGTIEKHGRHAGPGQIRSANLTSSSLGGQFAHGEEVAGWIPAQAHVFEAPLVDLA